MRIDDLVGGRIDDLVGRRIDDLVVARIDDLVAPGAVVVVDRQLQGSPPLDLPVAAPPPACPSSPTFGNRGPC